MKLLSWVSIAAFVGAVGCSSSSGGTTETTVKGTIAGVAVPSTDGVGLSGPVQVTNGTVTATAFEVSAIISNQDNLCALVKSDGNPPNGTALTVAVGSTSMVAPGTYPIGAGLGSDAAVNFMAQDATCTPTENSTATSGSITLSTVSSTTVAGSFDATFPGGDHLTGTFSVPVCDASIGALAMGAQTACSP